ncbi:hypothetical protein BJV82DRAFT_638128 [Fennellomyces sp. T-0311]|nr:hypothetical protein BJV82DRAFT_638128 [Fennellomyces sp. T-0311]
MTVPSKIKLPRYSFLLPGKSALNLAQHTLIDKNHKEHDIFFNDAGFHNHLIHHYLTAYSMGASMERLQAIYKGHLFLLRPKPASVCDLTRETYRKEIGNRNAYTSYLNLFKEEIDKYGVLDTIRYWIFKDDMLARFVAGAYHPLIHLGYAIEFDLPSVAAEALAMAACTEDNLVPIMHLTEDSEITNGTETIQDIMQKVATDPVFDGVVKYSDPSKLDTLMSNANAVSKLREYAAQWKFKDPESSLQELYVACLIVYAASGLREQGFKLDFYLMHALTSIHAVYTLLPNLTPIQAELLLRAHLAESIAYYVSRGRPALRIDLLLSYKSPHQDTSENRWMNIINTALTMEEVHMLKVIRALALGQVLYGGELDAAWANAAQMTLDMTGGSTLFRDAKWNHEGIGFDEAWKSSSL